MMKNGLLHSMPRNVSEKYPELLDLIEICAENSPHLNRFKSSKLLMELIEKILEDQELIRSFNDANIMKYDDLIG